MNSIYIYNYLQRIVNAVGGVFVIFIMSNSYSLDEADLFYTQYAFLGSIIIYEFGYSVMLVQRLSANNKGDNKKLESLLKHYSVVTQIFFIIMVLSFPILHTIILSDSPLDNLYFIICFGFLLSCMLITNMRMCIIEGLGYIKEVSLIRFSQALISYVAIAISLLMGLRQYSILIFLMFQLVTVYVVILRHENLKKHFINLVEFELFSFDIVKKDFRFNMQLYLSSIAGLFFNQAWIIAIASLNRYNVSQYAITLQIVIAAAGFALTPIMSRLSHISKLSIDEFRWSNENRMLFDVIKHVILSSIICILSVLFLYILAREFFSNRILTFDDTKWFLLSLPFLIMTNVIGILVQSRGKRDIVLVSLFRIISPSILFMIIMLDLVDIDIALSYFSSSLLACFLALMYFYKEFKYEKN